MRNGIRIGQPFVYMGTEHEDLRGQSGIVLGVLSPRLLLVAFELEDGRRPVVKVTPEEIGATEEEAARFLRPVVYGAVR